MGGDDDRGRARRTLPRVRDQRVRLGTRRIRKVLRVRQRLDDAACRTVEVDAGLGRGVVGVLGPTRMAYPQAIGTVRFVSSLMNELVEQLYR